VAVSVVDALCPGHERRVVDRDRRITNCAHSVLELRAFAARVGPMFEPLRDVAYFAQVVVDEELGTVVWPDGADLAPGRASRAGDEPGLTTVSSDVTDLRRSEHGTARPDVALVAGRRVHRHRVS
jgi:hypothetical protein